VDDFNGASFYWSSSTYAHEFYGSFAWHIYFVNGFVDFAHKLTFNYVRAVRGGP
jgi:hypothetical protein